MTRITSGPERVLISPYQLAADVHPDIRVQRTGTVGEGAFVGFVCPNGTALWYGPHALGEPESIEYIKRSLHNELAKADAGSAHKGKRSS